MDEKWIQRKNENRIEYIKRITNLRTEYDMSYSEWCYLITGGADYSEDNSRKAYYVVEKMLPLISYQLELDEAKVKRYNDLHSKEVQIQKERERQKDERRAYTNLVKSQARWEQILETLEIGLREADTSKFLDSVVKYEVEEENEAVLMLSDTHIGMTINNALNVYNKEVCIKRFNKLVEQVLKNCKKNSVKRLNVIIAGDIIEGIINTSGRVTQNENVVEQIFTASELVTETLVKLSLSIPQIRVWNTNGNHARMSKDTKESLNGESFETIIYEYVKMRIEILKQRDKIGWNIKFNENDYPDIAVVEIENCDKLVVASHGTKDRSIKNNLSRINQFLDIKADYYLMGHVHHSAHEYNCYTNGCLSGSNEYAQNQRYNNEPMQIMLIFFENSSTVLCEMNLKE
jgi:hypothetical protein